MFSNNEFTMTDFLSGPEPIFRLHGADAWENMPSSPGAGTLCNLASAALFTVAGKACVCL